jgi:mRNA interferase YafQ
MIVKWTSKFKKDYKICLKKHLDVTLLDSLIEKLKNEETLGEIYSDHELIGNWKGFRECHISGKNSDWLLIYRIDNDVLVLTLVRTGTHSDLFKN